MLRIRVSGSSQKILKIPLIQTELLDRYEYTVVPKNEDLFLEHHSARLSGEYARAKTALYVADENIRRRKSLYNVVNPRFRSVFGRNLPYDWRVRPLLMKTPFYRYPDLVAMVRSIQSMKARRQYAVIHNHDRGVNLFSLPQGFLYFSADDLVSRPISAEPDKRRFCCAIISNPHARDRIRFIKQLSRYKKVDVYGLSGYQNSTDPDFAPIRQADMKTNVYAELTKQNERLFRKYKFVVCFENTFSQDYVTEKLPNVMRGHSIPVYRGAPNVGDFFNTRSMINYDDHNQSYADMIRQIIDLDTDEQKYCEYLSQPWLDPHHVTAIEDKRAGARAFIDSVVKVATDDRVSARD